MEPLFDTVLPPLHQDLSLRSNGGLHTPSRAGAQRSDVQFSEDEFIQAGLLHPYTVATFIDCPVESSVHDRGEQIMNTNGSSMLADQHNQVLSPLPQISAQNEQTTGPVDKKAANREHQKRFRDRQKAKAQLLEVQLAKTIEELNSLKLQQQELENQLLQAQQAEASPEPQLYEAKIAQLTKEFIEGPPMEVSLSGKECRLSIKDVGALTPAHFGSLWTGYVEEMKSCLNALEGRKDPVVQDRLMQLVWEALRLKCHHLFGSHVKQARAMPRPHMLNNPCDYLLSVFDLSDDQIGDLMFLREVYVLKERELTLQQAALTADLQNHNPDPLSEVTRVASIGTQLRIHAAQSHQLIQRLCWALYFGIFTQKQSAQLLVHCDPNLILAEVLLHHIAEKQGLPSKQELLRTHGHLKVEDWNRFWKYTETINPYVRRRFDYSRIPAVKKSPSPTTVTLY